MYPRGFAVKDNHKLIIKKLFKGHFVIQPQSFEHVHELNRMFCLCGTAAEASRNCDQCDPESLLKVRVIIQLAVHSYLIFNNINRVSVDWNANHVPSAVDERPPNVFGDCGSDPDREKWIKVQRTAVIACHRSGSDKIRGWREMKQWLFLLNRYDRTSLIIISTLNPKLKDNSNIS